MVLGMLLNLSIPFFSLFIKQEYQPQYNIIYFIVFLPFGDRGLNDIKHRKHLGQDVAYVSTQ